MIYDFRILPFALGDVVISMIHGAIDLKGEASKFPFYFYRNDLVKVHPIQSFINKRNAKKQLGDLNEALLFNPLQLPIKKITKELENTGCETSQDYVIQEFYQKYLETKQVKEYHSFFDSNIASHKSLNQWYEENNKIPQLQASRDLTLQTKKLIKQYTGKNQWICVHLRFRGIEKDADLADPKRNADPGFWHTILSAIGQEYQNDHAILLLGPAGSYPDRFYKIPNLHAVSTMGGTLKNSIAAILSASAFIGSSSGFANCATFSSTPYLIFDVSESGYNNYCIKNGSPRLPFAQKQQYLSAQSDSPLMIKKKIRILLPRLKKQSKCCLNKSEIVGARNHHSKNKAFSHIVLKLLNKVDIESNNELFSEICLLEKAVPELKEDAILKWVKSKSLLGFHEGQKRDEECLKIIKKLKRKSVDAMMKEIWQNPKIQIGDAISLYHKNWPTFNCDLDALAIRNLLGRFNSLGVQTVERENLRILFFFWKCWYRLFYKPFRRFHF